MVYVLPNRLRQLYLSMERAVHRVDPVPGTGKSNWKFWNYYKTNNCLQERKLHGDPDHRKYSRGKRYPSNLPNAWDDYPKSRSHNEKDWKKVKKKKQWMKKGDNIMFPTFTPLGAESSAENVVEGVASEKKKHNYDMSETKAKGEDYTRPAMDAAQTEKSGDDLRADVGDGYMDMRSELDYPNVGEITEYDKNPEKDQGQPGVRVYQDPFADVGQPPVEDILPPEDDTPVVVDDSLKHGTKLKYRIGGDEGKTGSE